MPASILKSLIVGTDAILALDGTCRLLEYIYDVVVEMKYITSMIELSGQ
jgi:hypothetical protein